MSSLAERLQQLRGATAPEPPPPPPSWAPPRGGSPASELPASGTTPSRPLVSPGGLPEGGPVNPGTPPPGGDEAPDRIEVTKLQPRERPESGHQSDPLRQLRDKVSATLFERLGATLAQSGVDEANLTAVVQREINKIIEAEPSPLTGVERQRLIHEVMHDVVGLGPLEALLADDSVSEIMVNGPDNVYVERNGKLTLAPVTFDDEPHLRRVIERIVTRVGRRIDEASPLVDARLLDGSRVNAIIPPLAFSGSTLTIRKFSKEALQIEDLISYGSITAKMADLLRACVEAKLNMLVVGGTGSGKTTMLNVLSSFIPDGERIVTIEDSVELQLQKNHLVRLETRPPNTEGKGEVSIRDLVKNSLRMRPDRIVVGECRGAEALDMLQAMNTGHDGSLTTLHANSPRDAIARLETLVLMAGMDLPQRAIREQIASAINLVVNIGRLRDGTRRVLKITEVDGMEGNTVTLADIFSFDYSAGIGPDGRFLGEPQAEGIRPKFADRFDDLGIRYHPSLFERG